MSEAIDIIKASGKKEAFSEKKYRSSLRRSGASQSMIDDVMIKIRPHIHAGMTTKELYRLTNQLLKKKKRRAVAGRYQLKQAIMQLGPSGYPFEKYVGKLLKHQGYKVVVGKEVPGRCVSHEVDVIATKNNERFIIECKFHNRSGIRSALHVPLYVKSRYDDIQEQCERDVTCGPKYNGCWVVTNTKFTSVAIDYGECRKLIMLAWAYPRDRGLEQLIDTRGLHPVTCLTTLTKQLKQALLQEGIVLCRDIEQNRVVLERLRLDEKKIAAIMADARAVCEGSEHHNT